MTTVAKVIGGPGAGKTTRLLDIMNKVIDNLGIDPMQIGFVSFTRAARREAAARAGAKFDIPPAQLEKDGWFRTIHSTCYRLLGTAAGELITGSKDDAEWLKNACNDENMRSRSSVDQNDDALAFSIDESRAGRSLAMWDVCRNRLVPIDTVWSECAADPRVPSIGDVKTTISIYEESKRRDGRLDFCDLLMLFAGKRWTGNHDSPFEDEEPHGDVQSLPVWFGDEWQDTSLLASLVFCRLTRDSLYAYLAGDGNQAIFTWAGSDGRIFSEWTNVAKEDFLPISHRCAKNILDVGKGIIQDARLAGFNPHKDGGVVDRDDFAAALSAIKPGRDTLVLARTNDYARNAARILDEAGIPWKPTKGAGGFAAPARAAGVEALVLLAQGKGINGEQVHRLMELLPVNTGGVRLFEHGAKAHYADKEERAKMHTIVPLTLAESADAGCTEAFRELVSSGRYIDLLEKPAAKMAAAAQKHGVEAVKNPTVRLGTTHSAKGMEAERVVLLNQLPYPVQQACQTPEGMAEERKVWYVTATRAKEHLTICEGGGEGFDGL